MEEIRCKKDSVQVYEFDLYIPKSLAERKVAGFVSLASLIASCLDERLVLVS